MENGVPFNLLKETIENAEILIVIKQRQDIENILHVDRPNTKLFNNFKKKNVS